MLDPFMKDDTKDSLQGIAIIAATALILMLLAGCSGDGPSDRQSAPDVGSHFATFHRTIEGHDCLFLQYSNGVGTSSVYAVTKVECDDHW